MLCDSDLTTATGTDGLAIADISDTPDEAIEELAELLRESVRHLLPPAQFLFTYMAAISKKTPTSNGALASSPHRFVYLADC